MTSGVRGSTARRKALLGVIALVAVAAGLLSACANLPSAGPVVQGSALPSAPVIRPVARPPAAGMSPEEVVAGFLRACTGLPDDLVVARQYLTEAAAEEWEPTAATRVVDEQTIDLEQRQAPSEQVTLTATQQGTVDASGHWSGKEQPLEQRYALRKVDSQWRISATPPGITVNSSAFRRVWASRSVFFTNPGMTHVVPDPVVSPASGSQLATALVQDLLAGPQRWLAPAVSTGVPAGTRLELSAVPVTDGVARVELSRQALEAGDDERRAMSAQFAYTLAQVPGVAAFRLLVDGQPLAVPGADELQSVTGWADFSPTGLSPRSAAYFVAGDGSVQQYRAGRASAVLGAAGLPRSGFRSIAVPLEEDAIIGRVDGGQLMRAPIAVEPPSVIMSKPGAAPALDRGGAVWTVSDKQIYRLTYGGWGVPMAVGQADVPGPVRIAVPSRDGSRVAVIVGSRLKKARLYVGRVVALAGTVRVEEPRLIPGVGEGVRDVAWASGTTLAVVQDGALVQVDLARGSAARTGGPPQIDSVAAADGLPPLVSAADGQIFALVQGRWQAIAVGSSPAYPG